MSLFRSLLLSVTVIGTLRCSSVAADESIGREAEQVSIQVAKMDEAEFSAAASSHRDSSDSRLNYSLSCDGKRLRFQFRNRVCLTTKSNPEFIIQRVHRISSSKIVEQFLVEAAQVSRGKCVSLDTHTVELPVRSSASETRMIETGIGTVDGHLPTTVWPFAKPSSILSSISSRTDYDKCRFSQKVTWSISAETDPQNDHYAIEVPAINLTVAGRISELITRSGHGDIDPGRGIGCLKIGLTTVLDAKRILGEPIRTDLLTSKASNGYVVTYFEPGIGIVADAESQLVIRLIAFPPYVGNTFGAEKLVVGQPLPAAFQTLAHGNPSERIARIPGATIRLRLDKTVESVHVYSAMKSSEVEPSPSVYEPQRLDIILRP